MSLRILRGYVYSFCQIFQRLHLFKELHLFWTLEYLLKYVCKGKPKSIKIQFLTIAITKELILVKTNVLQKIFQSPKYTIHLEKINVFYEIRSQETTTFTPKTQVIQFSFILAMYNTIESHFTLSLCLPNMQFRMKYRKVASSRPVYYSIFDYFWGATN